MTATVGPRPPAAHVAVAPAWTTPEILKTGLVAIWATSLLLMGAALFGARMHRHAMQAIGKDSAPSIIAAQHIRSALADMDADAANELLAAGPQKPFEDRREEAISGVVSAAENITYGDAERTPIQQLALGIGTYTGQVTAARIRQSSGDKGYLAVWRSGAEYMDQKLLPEALALDKANRDELDRAWENQRSGSVEAAVLLILGGVLLGGVLTAMQIFLSTRMKRTLNPMLFLATLGTLAFVVYAGQRFAASDRDLTLAKKDAFESIHALWRARAVAYSANGDESRYLLDPGHASKYEGDFQEKAAQIDDLLKAELKNITFEGEEAAARDAVTQFGAYRAIDARIREWEKSGRHAAAVELCTGSGEQQSNGVFARFDAALERTLKVNQEAFDAAVVRGFADVAWFEYVAPGAAALISLLGWLGLRIRIREYSV